MERGLMRIVVKLIETFGPSSVDDLTPKLTDCTRKQIMAALANARTAGLLTAATRKPCFGRVGAGSYPAVYSLPSPSGEIVRPKAKGRPVSSVFDLANYV